MAAREWIVLAWRTVGLACALMVCPLSSSAGSSGPIPLSDAELSTITGGVTEINIQVVNDVITLEQGGEFLTFLQGNAAFDFNQGISGNAFRGAEGVFTTLQAVNSVIQLDMVVNIYLDGLDGV